MWSASIDARRAAIALVIASCLPWLPLTATAQGRQPKVVQLEDIVIESEVQKPTAFYILNRSSLGYEITDLRTSFIDEIVRSAHRDPF